MAVSRKAYKDAENAYKSDVRNFDFTERGNIHRIDEYRFIGKLRKSLIFSPLKFFRFQRAEQYRYHRSVKLCIDEVTKSEELRHLFEIYGIHAINKYGYFTFASQYTIPDELSEAGIPQGGKQALIVQHFTTSASRIIDDVGSTKFFDLVTVDSLTDATRLELHFEPFGMYESVAIKDSTLKRHMALAHLGYLILAPLIIIPLIKLIFWIYGA